MARLSGGGGGGGGIDPAILSGKGSTIGASAAGTAVDVPVGADGTVQTADSTAAGGFAWSLKGFGVQVRSGSYSELQQGANTTAAVGGTLSQARSFPVVFAGPITISEIYMNITVAAGAGNVVRVAFYDSTAGGIPGSLVSEMGTMLIDGTGEKSILSLALALIPGKLYHFCWVVQGSGGLGTASAAQVPIFAAPAAARVYTDQNWGTFSTTTISGAFPGTWPWGGVLGPASPRPPVIFVKAV